MKKSSLLIFGLLMYGAAFAQESSTPSSSLAYAHTLPAKKETNNLRLNQIQVIGSHNSYKKAINPAVLQMLKSTNGKLADGIEYSHISIIDQLNMGLSNLEIDIYADAKGGKYAHPKGLELEKNQAEAYDPEHEMLRPGFKILHIQDIDYRSHYLTLEKCLQDLKKWSDEHPDHNPVFITMNAKDQEIQKGGYTVPEKFTPEVFDQLDKVILNNLGKSKVITPDQVRGKYNTLEQAVLKQNWPTLKQAKGKFIFVLDETDEKRTTYLQGHPSLKNRVLFANAEPGTPEAAILILNDPTKDQSRIQEAVKKGYIVRTRADANTEQARTNDKSMFEAACKSGAQIITTDYYQKSTHFPSDYQVSFEGESYFRANPLLKK